VALGLCAALVTGAWSASATAAGSPTVIEPAGCCGSSTVASFGGWAAWSRSDAATHQFQLVLRSPQGTVSTPALPERAEPFDVQIGPTASGPVAVYSRCSDARTLHGCSLRELVLAAQPAERTLSPPLSGSLHEPAIANGELVFLRRRGNGSENPERPSARPDDLYAWSIGSRRASQQALAVSKGSRGNVSWPRGLTGVISGLTVASGSIAYVTDTSDGGTFALSTLWAQRLGQGPRLIDQVTGGAGNVCHPEFLSPALSAQKLTAFLHACATSNPILDRWTRYSLSGRTAERAAYRFTGSSDEVISSLLPDGSGAIWSAEQGILATGSVQFRPFARPSPESFCGHSDLIC
jgi:hypothetical protein